MKVLITEYLRIDLDSERWECRVCNHDIGPARGNYKEGLLVHDRDPREIHKPLLDPKRYTYTFAPNPKWCAILEYCCPGCGTMVEVEYIVPGHPPVHDIELDIDALKLQWASRTEQREHVAAGDAPREHHHHHGEQAR
ncbi:MAG: acetone carboxylase subunit gamma [Panacagrimonas sp.]